jgi:hypothetical protein
MTAQEIYRRLDEVGQKIGLRQAAIRLAIAGATALALLWLLAMSDMLLHFQRAGRVIGGGLLLAAAGAALWIIGAALRKPRPREAIAVSVERMFPELDNHLINYLQFSRAGEEHDAMISAYLAAELPAWGAIDGKKWQDRKLWLRSWSAFAGVIAIVGLTALWSGPGWFNAAARILNPFSARPPATFGRILEVKPGDGYVMIGSPLTLNLKADGKSGQKVLLDLWPQDDKKSTLQLGKLRGGAQEFAYTLPRVTTGLKYRFRAGDAESDTFGIKALTPLAFKRVDVTITPAVSTALPARQFAALAAPVIVPQGSAMRVLVEANRPLQSALLLNGTNECRLTQKSGEALGGTLTITEGESLRLVGEDTFGGHVETLLNLEILRDKAPDIRIVQPASKAMLGISGAPRIEFEVNDDYALDHVTLERVLSDGREAKTEVVGDFPLQGEKKFAKTWAAENFTFPAGANTVTYRLVATDRVAPGLTTHRALSSPIVFEVYSAAAAASNSNARAASEVANTLHKLVELQAANVERTIRLDVEKQYTDTKLWGQVSDVQSDVRRLAGALISDPRKPLGGMTLMMRDLHGGAMSHAVTTLQRLQQSPAAGRPELASNALVLERLILRTLTMTSESIKKVEQGREISGLVALLDALVIGQQKTLDTTGIFLRKAEKIARDLVDKQDRLAQDTTEFLKSCRKESTSLQQNDKAFADLLAKIADAGEKDDKVAAKMLGASEQLEQNAPDKAQPLQTTALTDLKQYQKILTEWRAQDAKEKMAELQQAVDKARDELKKLAELQKEITKNIRQTLQQADKSDKKVDELTLDIKEAQNNMKEAALQIAKDLQIFADLPVGNELVADVNQIYEEIEQVAGSESNPTTELGLQKEDWVLGALEAAGKRADDLEMWLMSQPDNKKRDTEAFDKQELPQIPLITLPSEFNDIIGDLLEQEKKEEEKADDSATNQGSAQNTLNGWGIAEGEFANYAAQGKSGNERPDHKEQDGKSLVGRQGMSDGETAAGSGKINEGDNNIEKRMTQDSMQSGQVQEEGHAEAKATGGGKMGGYSDELGMAGNGPRRDTDAKGNDAGWQAMLRRNADALFAKASMSHLRTGSLDEAARYMRDAEVAIQKGLPIREVREFQRKAIAALKRTQAELQAGGATQIPTGRSGRGPDEQLASAADDSPPAYRDMNSEYFKALSEAPPP